MSNRSLVFFFDNESPEMQHAIKRARQTFRCFWRDVSWEYRRIIPALDLACVKGAFWDDAEPAAESTVEQMWVNDVTFDGKELQGTLINQPNWLTSVSQGDSVCFKPDRITDWMYAIQNRVCGAFTVNAMRRAMSITEREAHDEAWGLDFGDPREIRLVP
ncbi:MAG: DUF2314 domain-containing protein [Planctomycetaceae bacterium]|nr:DUF2314 domain-containing protein [Planctomycetaceae bacterium]